MIIGVLSDTHDQYARTGLAVETLLREGARALIHCGDICEVNMLDLIAGEVPAYFVFGNNDWDREGLERQARHLGITCLGTHGTVVLGGKTLGVAHGDRGKPLQELAAMAEVRYLLTGHTHVAEDEQDGVLRRVNPGALHRTRRPSVATIDLAMDAVRFHML